ncbi:slipin family protein [Leifsonia sp. NPDC058230]|uniref:slipin family protein n=1 Tax=Leifsonia sp. NPDC058230 TaxID=3346391 RepID=UPI0036DB1D05
MVVFYVVLAIVVVIAIILFFMSVRVVKQYERGVVLRYGRLHGTREPGLRFIIPIVDVMHRVSLRIVTLPIQSQGIITRDNVSVGVSAVAYYRVVDPVKSVLAIESVEGAINQIAQTTLRKVVGQHTLDETLAETDALNVNIREILDLLTLDWGVEVTLVELKDILLPDEMKRAMAKQAEAEREKRAKIIAAQGESLAAAALGDASDTMMAHPLALQLRNLQSLVEIGVDKNTVVVFPAPLMSTIGELGSFLAREGTASLGYSPSLAGTPVGTPAVPEPGGTAQGVEADRPAAAPAAAPEPVQPAAPVPSLPDAA